MTNFDTRKYSFMVSFNFVCDIYNCMFMEKEYKDKTKTNGNIAAFDYSFSW